MFYWKLNTSGQQCGVETLRLCWGSDFPDQTASCGCVEPLAHGAISLLITTLLFGGQASDKNDVFKTFPLDYNRYMLNKLACEWKHVSERVVRGSFVTRFARRWAQHFKIKRCNRNHSSSVFWPVQISCDNTISPCKAVILNCEIEL